MKAAILYLFRARTLQRIRPPRFYCPPVSRAPALPPACRPVLLVAAAADRLLVSTSPAMFSVCDCFGGSAARPPARRRQHVKRLLRKARSIFTRSGPHSRTNSAPTSEAGSDDTSNRAESVADDFADIWVPDVEILDPHGGNAFNDQQGPDQDLMELSMSTVSSAPLVP